MTIYLKLITNVHLINIIERIPQDSLGLHSNLKLRVSSDFYICMKENKTVKA